MTNHDVPAPPAARRQAAPRSTPRSVRDSVPGPLAPPLHVTSAHAPAALLAVASLCDLAWAVGGGPAWVDRGLGANAAGLVTALPVVWRWLGGWAAGGNSPGTGRGPGGGVGLGMVGLAAYALALCARCDDEHAARAVATGASVAGLALLSGAGICESVARRRATGTNTDREDEHGDS